MPETGRALGMSEEDRKELGRWKGSSDSSQRLPNSMANRYSQESSVARGLSVRVRCINGIRRVKKGKPDALWFDSLPPFGGWELITENEFHRDAPLFVQSDSDVDPSGSDEEATPVSQMLSEYMAAPDSSVRHVVNTATKLTSCGKPVKPNWTICHQDSVPLCQRCASKKARNKKQ
jgi:hypothetical protein